LLTFPFFIIPPLGRFYEIPSDSKRARRLARQPQQHQFAPSRQAVRTFRSYPLSAGRERNDRIRLSTGNRGGFRFAFLSCGIRRRRLRFFSPFSRRPQLSAAFSPTCLIRPFPSLRSTSDRNSGSDLRFSSDIIGLPFFSCFLSPIPGGGFSPSRMSHIEAL